MQATFREFRLALLQFIRELSIDAVYFLGLGALTAFLAHADHPIQEFALETLFGLLDSRFIALVAAFLIIYFAADIGLGFCVRTDRPLEQYGAFDRFLHRSVKGVFSEERREWMTGRMAGVLGAPIGFWLPFVATNAHDYLRLWLLLVITCVAFGVGVCAFKAIMFTGLENLTRPQYGIRAVAGLGIAGTLPVYAIIYRVSEARNTDYTKEALWFIPLLLVDMIPVSLVYLITQHELDVKKQQRK